MPRRRPKPRPAPERPASVAVEEAPSEGLFGGAEPDVARWGEWLRRVSLGLLAALIVARAYFPGEDAERGTGSGWVLAMLLTSALAVVSAWLQRSVRARLSWADAAVAVLVVLVGLSVRQGADRRLAIVLGWEWVGLGLSYALLRCLPRTRGESQALAGTLLVTACALSASGFYQRYVEDPDTIALYKRDPARALALAGVPDDPASRKRFEDRLLRSTEPRGPFALANSLAGYLVGPSVIGLAAALGLALDRKRASKIGPLVLAAMPLMMLLACLVLTKSRSAYVGLAVGLAAVALRYRRRVNGRRLALAGLVLAVLLGLILAIGAYRRILDRQVLTESTKSLRYRVEWWQATWALINESSRHFWAGVGPANFAGPYLRYKLETSSEEIKDPHNLFLEVWACSGAGAAAALLAAVVLILRETLGATRDTGEPPSAAPPDPGSSRTPPWLWVCAGAGGWQLVVLLGPLDPFNSPDDLARWLVLGAGWAASALLLAPLLSRRPAEGAELGAGFLAVTVNLLAAGGIAFPPVALMFWSLGAIGQNLRDDQPCGAPRRLGGRGLAFVTAAGLAALIGTFVGAMLPAWKARAAMAEGHEALMGPGPPKVERAREAYRRAAEADPYAAEPRMALAELAFRAWLAEGARPGSGVWIEVARALDDAATPPRNPDSLTVQRQRIRLLQELIRLQGPSLSPAGLRALYEDLVNASARAVSLYPNDARLRAGLAEAAAGLGRLDEAVQQAREALRLDARTPHKDRKLPDGVRKRLEEALPRWEAEARGESGAAGPARGDQSPGGAPARGGESGSGSR
jgi:hypothetical protein